MLVCNWPVTALHGVDLAQVALGDARRHRQGLAQGLGDLQGDQPGSQGPRYQC